MLIGHQGKEEGRTSRKAIKEERILRKKGHQEKKDRKEGRKDIKEPPSSSSSLPSYFSHSLPPTIPVRPSLVLQIVLRALLKLVPPLPGPFLHHLPSLFFLHIAPSLPFTPFPWFYLPVLPSSSPPLFYLCPVAVSALSHPLSTTVSIMTIATTQTTAIITTAATIKHIYIYIYIYIQQQPCCSKQSCCSTVMISSNLS
jgi:hypothetical protein